MTIVGTRPELIRLSCILKELEKYVESVLVHTGQNYDYELNEIFFEDIRMHEDHLFVSRLFYCREKASYPGIITHSRRSTSLESLGRTVGYEVCISSAKNLFFYFLQ